MDKDNFKQIYPFHIKQDVIWGDMDAFKHVNNTVYFRYFEGVRMALFEVTSVISNMNATQIGPIMASIQCQFKAPLSFPDKILIGTRIKEIGAKKFTMEYAVFSELQNTIVSTGEGLIVFYDYKSGKSTEIPNNIRRNFNDTLNSRHH
ncbi:thioesterase family protein [Oceaniserpentilla sp. 4NH20-0058]|uniref:acyl-CoA thioesterase n=1 Tax=Oceaniserpentilla sp. 4NH20-0058 TaxID=3127660 RepID=UPI00310ACC25